MIEGLADEMARTLDRWLYENIKSYLPEKFDTRAKVENNPQEVALFLERRGIELSSSVPTSGKYEDKITRFWTLRDKSNDEIIATLNINIKTGNEVV